MNAFYLVSIFRLTIAQIAQKPPFVRLQQKEGMGHKRQGRFTD
jgi:hypothetical protein